MTVRLSIALVCGMFAHAQASNPTPSVPSTTTSYPRGDVGIGRTSDYGFAGSDPSFSHRQMVARREEAYRRMKESAARLVTLTRELQESIHTHDADAADAKRLDEIAKLARVVRDQMRQ